MTLMLKRREYLQDGIFGDMYHDGKHLAVTLEHAFGLGPVYEPKLATGTYTCVRGIHKLHNGVPFETFEISRVPNYAGKPVTGVLIHPGNFNQDSEGCVLVGESEVQSSGHEMITNSKQTFEKIMKLLDGLDSFQLIVT